MPRYFLHLLDGTEIELDRVGLQFANDEEALAEVSRAIKELRMEDFSADDWTNSVLEIVESGRTVQRLTLGSFGEASLSGAPKRS